MTTYLHLHNGSLPPNPARALGLKPKKPGPHNVVGALHAFYSEDQPRDANGRWGDGGADKVDETKYAGSGTKEDPYKVSSGAEAARLISEGKYVEMPEHTVGTLLNELHRIAQEANKAGDQKAKDYNLCLVSVSDSNLFCADNKGIERTKMPQFAGKDIRPGSTADGMERNGKGEVDVSAQFLEHLREQGVAVTDTTAKADELKASQNELVGTKVAGIMTAMNEDRGVYHAIKTEPIFVSRDNYVIDGHHRWAAVVGTEYTSEHQNVDMHVYKVDMPISVVLAEANKFTNDMGIIPKAGSGVVASAMLRSFWIAETLWEFWNEDQPRDENGRWGGGGSSVDVVGPSTNIGTAGKTLDSASADRFPATYMEKVDAQIATQMHVTIEQGDRNMQAVFDRAMRNPESSAQRDWYFERHDEANKIDADYRLPQGTAAAMLAAISPGNDWENELSEVRAILDGLTDTTRTVDVDRDALDAYNYAQMIGLTDKAADAVADPGSMFVDNGKLYDELSSTDAAWAIRQEYLAANPKGSDGYIPWGLQSYEGFAKAVDIARGGDPDKVLVGEKVRSFYNNIAHPESDRDVTIDARMVRAFADNPRLTVSSTIMGGKYEGMPAGPYVRVADSVRGVTDRWNEAHPGMEMTPHQVQAIIWTEWGKVNDGA